MDIHDQTRSGWSSILTNEMLEKVQNFVREDCRLTLDELYARFPEFPQSLIHEAITDKLGFHISEGFRLLHDKTSLV